MSGQAAGGGDRRTALLWGGSLLAVLAIHLLAFHLLSEVTPVREMQVPDAILIDLAPAPDAPPIQPPQEAPVPQSVQPPPPVVPVPVAPLPPPPKPRPAAHAAPRPPTVTPPPMTAAPAAVPAPAPPPEIASNWQSRLLSHLARFKRFPMDAQRRGEQGTALMRFRMDRAGHLLSASVARSSGYADLDTEAEAWISRADPLPGLPPELPQAVMELVVPLRFSLH